MQVVTLDKPKGVAASFLEFILSEDGQNIIEELGFLPIN
jgi:ABC-type phosphate transport system substrate-binding protein